MLSFQRCSSKLQQTASHLTEADHRKFFSFWGKWNKEGEGNKPDKILPALCHVVPETRGYQARWLPKSSPGVVWDLTMFSFLYQAYEPKYFFKTRNELM